MEIPVSIKDARKMMIEFAASGELANLPEFTKEKVIEALSDLNIASQVVKFGEAIYAEAANVNAEARNAAAKAIGFASGFTGFGPFHGLEKEDRGSRMVQAFRRRNGHVTPAGLAKWPSADTDPEPKPQFVKPEPVEEAPQEDTEATAPGKVVPKL